MFFTLGSKILDFVAVAKILPAGAKFHY